MEPRTSQYVLSKLSNLMSNGENEAGLRQYWMPDDISVECYDCTSKFTSFRRRHHCRVCGQIFCSKCCSSYIPGKQIGYSGNLRVCTFCFSYFETYVEQGQGLASEAQDGPERESAPYMGRRQSLETAVGSITVPREYSSSLSLNSPLVSYRAGRKASSCTNVYESIGGEGLGEGEKDRHETVKLKDPAALARLWQRVLDPEAGLAMETHRYYLRSYPGTFLGTELVDWLASQDRTTSRAQAVAIGQALLKASHITSLSGQSVFTDSTEIFQPGPSQTPEEEPDDPGTPETVQGPLWLQQLTDVQSSDSSRSFDVPDLTIRVKKLTEIDRRISNEKSVTEHQKLQFDLLRGTIEEQVGVSADSTSLDKVYKRHEAWYLDNLLDGAELGKEWAGVVLNLADHAVKNVSPDSRNGGDEMDIRWYVKVKSVPGGRAADSSLIPGEVCSLQPAHRRMADRLLKPSIALVANSIVFQREESRFVSLETVWMQEEEYIKNMCGKLMSARPNIIMVERTVSRLAQDIFLREGVTLVLNVKYRVLERLARLTQAKIISSVDSMLAPPKLGTCSSFFMKKFQISPLSRSLMVFEGVPPELGGTIVLRGGTKQLLAKVKTVLKRLLLVKFNWKHEKSFVLNEYGCLKDSLVETMSVSPNSSYKLAISPFIKVEQRDDAVLVAVAEETKEVPELLCTVSDRFDRRNDLIFVSDDSAEQHPWCKSFLTAHVKDGVEEENVQDMLALFRASGWRRPEFRTNAPVKLLTSISFCQPKPFPQDHSETLSVLFSSYSSQSSVAPNYCIPPWVVNMELYGNLDITLGGFLEDFCFSAEYQCPNKQCSTPITEHTRRFCHAGGGVEIHMQKLEAPIMGDSSKLMMWKYCTNCQLITPIVPVTNDTWSLSFALFLQLLLHDDHLVRRGYDRPDAVCCHSLHQEHLTCFGKMDAVATFKYTKLQVWRVAAPPYNPEMPRRPCGQEDLLCTLRTLKKHGGSVYSAVLELLLASKGDNPEGVAMLMPEQEAEFLAYTERVKALEEEVMSRDEHEVCTLDRLHLLARDILLAYQAWNGKLEKMQEMAKKKLQEKAKKNQNLHRSSSTEVLDLPVAVIKKAEPDTTVKKLISVILPPVEEALLPNPFPLDMHIITSVDGQKLDNPLSIFVMESQPSTIIAYLLSCGAYKDFMVKEQVDDQGLKNKGAPGEREESPGHDMEGIHCELQFSDAITKFYCCSYFPHWFDKLRTNIFPGREEDFIYSLSGCSRWEAMGGKSGLSFFKTDDDRFILKQMSRFEFQSFLEFAPHYFEYITQCINSKVKTLLGKIIGVYKIGFKNSSTGAGLKMDVLIMENLFYNRDITKSYDLKGAIRNRLTVTEGKNDLGLVLLDENLVRVSCESPLYINSQDRQSLVEAIKRDAAFLASHNMMDYSLLAGISKSSGELVLGIIDYIRTFTWDKKLETLMKSVKSSGFLGGQAKTPTVIHPDLYKLRFTEAMSRYFLLVPD